MAIASANIYPVAESFRYAVILEPDEDAVRVIVPSFPEIHTFGIDRDDALRMAADAIRLSIGYRREKGLDLPAPDADGARLEIVTVAARQLSRRPLRIRPGPCTAGAEFSRPRDSTRRNSGVSSRDGKPKAP